MKIEFFRHAINNEDIERANKVLKSIFLTNADVTSEFERKFAQYLDTKHCIAVSSCTAALHMSLIALGINEGDEIITTPLSFVATANAILHAGARPVFVDVEKETGNIDVTKIEEKITGKTKAIIPVHLYGNMADMVSIRKLADKYNLKVIEDAAHCIEGERDGIRPGILSDTACFSFYATKNITSGEGGAVVCHDKELAEKFYMLRLHGIDKDAGSRYTKRYSHWDMKMLGWKYNISDIQSALLIGQLDRIEENLAKREAIASFYEREFDRLGIDYIKVPKNTKSARHLFAMLVDNRDEVLVKLQKAGIGVAVNYRPIHLHTYYKNTFGYKDGDFPIAEYIGNRAISIPLYPGLTDKETEYIVNTLKSIVK
ncbi:MAG: DegT/DnrJ/EryC1/StrS family aminotransferase [Nitrospirota bacterium]